MSERPLATVIGEHQVALSPVEVALLAAVLDSRARGFTRLADHLGEHPRVHDARRAADLSRRVADLFAAGGEWTPRNRERRELEAAMRELGPAPWRGIRRLRDAIDSLVSDAPRSRTTVRAS
jgi:hypothetical protein